MADCAWNSLVSANKKAELKFRNVNPTLKYCLGCKYPATKRDLYPRRPKQATLLDIITEPHKVSFSCQHVDKRDGVRVVKSTKMKVGTKLRMVTVQMN